MQRSVSTLVGLGNFVVMSAVALHSQVKPSILQGINLLLRKQWCWVRVFVSFRVYDQHKLSKDQWEDRIKSWWGEHKGMMRSALLPTSPVHSWSLCTLSLFVVVFVSFFFLMWKFGIRLRVHSSMCAVTIALTHLLKFQGLWPMRSVIEI